MHKNLTAAGLSALASLSLFFFSPSQVFAQKDPETKVATATVLLREGAAPDGKALLQAMKTGWKIDTDNSSVSEKTIVVNLAGGLTLIVAHLPYPAPVDELGASARLSWLWPNAWEETRNHRSQWLITVAGSPAKSVEIYKLLTQATAAAAEASRAPGVFMSSQYLLLPSGFFTSAARNMVQNQTVPLYCWVYFGRPGGGNGFTHGMEELGFPEMEIVSSAQSEGEVHATLYDAAISVVKYGTKPQEGQSIVTEEGQKIPVSLQNGHFLEGKKVLKLDY